MLEPSLVETHSHSDGSCVMGRCESEEGLLEEGFQHCWRHQVGVHIDSHFASTGYPLAGSLARPGHLAYARPFHRNILYLAGRRRRANASSLPEGVIANDCFRSNSIRRPGELTVFHIGRQNSGNSLP